MSAVTAKDSVNSAQFDRKIQIQQNQPTYDAQGGQVPNWVTIYTCWADIQDFPHGRGLTRAFKFQQLFPQATTSIQIRYQKQVAIDASMRILFPWEGINHYFKILGVQNPSRANVSMFLICQEDQAKAVN